MACAQCAHEHAQTQHDRRFRCWFHEYYPWSLEDVFSKWGFRDGDSFHRFTHDAARILKDHGYSTVVETNGSHNVSIWGIFGPTEGHDADIYRGGFGDDSSDWAGEVPEAVRANMIFENNSYSDEECVSQQLPREVMELINDPNRYDAAAREYFRPWNPLNFKPLGGGDLTGGRPAPLALPTDPMEIRRVLLGKHRSALPLRLAHDMKGESTPAGANGRTGLAARARPSSGGTLIVNSHHVVKPYRAGRSVGPAGLRRGFHTLARALRLLL